jgi:hypothetical protein
MHVNGNSYNPSPETPAIGDQFRPAQLRLSSDRTSDVLNLDISSPFPINSFGTCAVMCNDKHDIVELVRYACVCAYARIRVEIAPSVG